MDLEHKAIERLKYASEISLAHYERPLLITYSVWKNIEPYWAWWMGENPDQLFVEEWET